MERISKGFSLVELILSMALLGIVVLVSGIIMGRGLDAYRLVTNRTEAVQDARFAFVRMQKELERLRDVTVASPQRIVFTDPDAADVEFRLVGTTLYRDADILAQGISALTFTYYRDNGNETSSGPQVRRIHIDMTVQAGGGAGTLALRTDLFPRIFIYENFQ